MFLFLFLCPVFVFAFLALAFLAVAFLSLPFASRNCEYSLEGDCCSCHLLSLCLALHGELGVNGCWCIVQPNRDIDAFGRASLRVCHLSTSRRPSSAALSVVIAWKQFRFQSEDCVAILPDLSPCIVTAPTWYFFE